MYQIVPFDPIQKSVSLAIADVIKKRASGKRVAEQPYATAFFRLFFGTTTPSRGNLCILCDNSETTIVQIKSDLNRFIESNGTVYTPLNDKFKKCAFPSLLTLDRFNAHFELKDTQQKKVKANAEIQHQELLERLKSDILRLSSKQLTSWVNETEEQINNLEQISLLSHWHQEKANDELPFHDLYFGFSSPMEIAVDLSYI